MHSGVCVGDMATSQTELPTSVAGSLATSAASPVDACNPVLGIHRFASIISLAAVEGPAPSMSDCDGSCSRAASMPLQYQRYILTTEFNMPPKPTESGKKSGKRVRTSSEGASVSTPSFKTRALPESRRLTAAATPGSPGAASSAVSSL
ncbi:hypothetical protein HaLaN_31067, partial [Haematococcus lacustris]